MKSVSTPVVLIAGMVALVCTGCVLSIEPIVPDSAATPNPLLVGTWAQEGESGSATFVQDGINQYSISYSAEGHTGSFGARLGTLGGRTILDVWPTPDKSDVGEPYDDVLIPGHLAFDIQISKDQLVVAALEIDSLSKALDRGTVTLDFTGTDGQLVLLGKSAAVRAGLASYVRRPEVWGDHSVWKRVAAKPIVPREIVAGNACFATSPWPDANRLFRSDPHWVGGDGSSTVDLGDGRFLWLFGDTWIDPTGRAQRRGATMVSNSVAIQNGADPSTASMKAYWKLGTGGNPIAFIPDGSRGAEGVRHWFGTGVLVRDRLILFQELVRSADNGIGFASAGWTAWMVDNPETEPSEWQIRELETPTNPLGIAPGFGASLQMDGYVYAFGSQDPVKSHPIFAARWPESDVHAGNLMHPEWWAGNDSGWVDDASDAPRWPLFENGQSGFTIHRDEQTQQFLAIHSRGFGPADIMLRTAPTLTGPWSEAQVIHHPTEFDRPNVMIYTARAHPELSGADLVLTYDTNTFDFSEQLIDEDIYYPRFVRISRCR